MGAWLLWLAVLAGAAAPGARAMDPKGSEGCRCVDPWTAEVLAQLPSLPNYVAAADGTGACVTGTDGFCYPVGTGASECRAWDAGTPVCTRPIEVGGPEPHCASSWCFVDASRCNRPREVTEVFAETPVLSGFSFSYETCGFLNDYTNRNVLVEELG